MTGQRPRALSRTRAKNPRRSHGVHRARTLHRTPATQAPSTPTRRSPPSIWPPRSSTPSTPTESSKIQWHRPQQPLPRTTEYHGPFATENSSPHVRAFTTSTAQRQGTAGTPLPPQGDTAIEILMIIENRVASYRSTIMRPATSRPPTIAGSPRPDRHPPPAAARPARRRPAVCLAQPARVCEPLRAQRTGAVRGEGDSPRLPAFQNHQETDAGAAFQRTS